MEPSAPQSVGSLKGGSRRKIKVMKEDDPRWVLIANAYDGLQEVGEVTIKAGRVVYHWIYKDKSVQAHSEPDVRYRNSIVELDKKLAVGSHDVECRW
jgi:hypothetical protein